MTQPRPNPGPSEADQCPRSHCSGLSHEGARALGADSWTEGLQMPLLNDPPTMPRADLKAWALAPPGRSGPVGRSPWPRARFPQRPDCLHAPSLGLGCPAEHVLAKAQEDKGQAGGGPTRGPHSSGDRMANSSHTGGDQNIQHRVSDRRRPRQPPCRALDRRILDSGTLSCHPPKGSQQPPTPAHWAGDHPLAV